MIKEEEGVFTVSLLIIAPIPLDGDDCPCFRRCGLIAALVATADGDAEEAVEEGVAFFVVSASSPCR